MENMDISLLTVFVLIGVITTTSLYALTNPYIANKYIFNIGAIRGDNRWDRILTSSFLHADEMHLFLNMYVLYMFAPYVIAGVGILLFFAIYFGAVIGGGLLSYYMNRNNYAYKALGASGGVTGVVMAFAAINPYAGMGIIFIPGSIPGFIFGFLYLVYSIYAMHQQRDNIGHDAHLGGAIVGIAIPLLVNPILFIENYAEVGIFILPLLYLGYYMYQRR